MSECLHENLHFGSGDYYLICKDCNRYWTMNPEYKNNIGAASLLSGEYRQSIKQLQASQEECAILKVQVNELQTRLDDCNHYQYVRDENEMQQAFNEGFEQDKQFLAAHDNEVIEKCAKIADQKMYECAYNSVGDAIRNLKTEGE